MSLRRVKIRHRRGQTKLLQISQLLRPLERSRRYEKIHRRRERTKLQPRSRRLTERLHRHMKMRRNKRLLPRQNRRPRRRSRTRHRRRRNRLRNRKTKIRIRKKNHRTSSDFIFARISNTASISRSRVFFDRTKLRALSGARIAHNGPQLGWLFELGAGNRLNLRSVIRLSV
jgi:hypothetical protein